MSVSKSSTGVLKKPTIPNFKRKEECSICLEIPSKEVGTLIECGHSFCLVCITKWLRTGIKCPMCNKTPVTVYSDGKRVKIGRSKRRETQDEIDERFEEDRVLAVQVMSEEISRQGLEFQGFGHIAQSMALSFVAERDPSPDPSPGFGIGLFQTFLQSNGDIRQTLARFFFGMPSSESDDDRPESSGGFLSEDESSSDEDRIGRVKREEPIFSYDEKAVQRGLISPLMEELEECWPTDEQSKRTATRGTRKGLSLGIEDSLSFPILTRIVTQAISQLKLGEPKSLWLNLYRNGDNYAPWHQDSYGGKVAIVSIGGARLFKTRPLADLDEEVETYNFGDGDLIFFNESWNSTHQHSVPKTKKKVSSRISIVIFW